MKEPELPPAAIEPSQMHDTNQVLALETVRLLCIDDNPKDTNQLKDLLQQSRLGKHQLDCTASTKEALAWLKAHKYHACLLSHQRSTETALSFMESAHTNHCHVPMIVLSSESEYMSDVESMLRGADNYLEREGLTARQLERTIRYAIHHQRQIDALRQQAEEDALTGLQNAGAFRKRLREAIARSQRSKKLVALLFIDMDGFKLVNDRHGHDLGDHVLSLIAQRIRQSVRETDIVGRIGGDEFAVVLEGLHTSEDTERVCQAIIDCICQPFSTPYIDMSIGASIGIALFPIHGKDPDQLIKFADLAMYTAKNEGGNRYFFYHHDGPTASPPTRQTKGKAKK